MAKKPRKLVRWEAECWTYARRGKVSIIQSDDGFPTLCEDREQAMRYREDGERVISVLVTVEEVRQ